MEAAVVAVIDEHELTPEEIEERRDACHELEVSIKDAIGRGRVAMWDLAKSLYVFNEEHGWSALGYETQGEWLAQPEIGMSKRQYHRMVRIWKETVITRAIPEADVIEIEPSKLEIVLPAIESNKTSVLEALEDARSMGVRDLRETYIGPQSAPTPLRDDEDDEDASGMDAEGKPKPKKKKEGPAFVHAAQVFDSWVTAGGDKRKAMRNWSKFLELHPLFGAVHLIEAFASGQPANGSEEIPTKDEVKLAWDTVLNSLRLSLPTE
jgi:hypothetical protein